MKPRLLFIALVTVILAMTGRWFIHAQSEGAATTSEIMKLKLDYAHMILNGIATDNFDLILHNAEKLTKLSQTTAWSARQSPQYEVLSADFRRQTEALAKAARDRNADAASLAYVQMTLSCVNCHKYMRGPKTASLR